VCSERSRNNNFMKIMFSLQVSLGIALLGFRISSYNAIGIRVTSHIDVYWAATWRYIPFVTNGVYA
jgi:hypothetical protein